MTAVALDIRCPPACVQEPPGRAGSFGDDVAEIAERIGRPLVPEQLQAVDVLMAHDARGRFLSVEAGLEGPRQTVGKSGGIMLPVALWTALTDPDHITWTAHLAETSLKQFADLCGEDPDDEAGLIMSCDWLRRRVRKPSYENGSEGVSFVNHAHIAFRVRSPGRGRGMSGNTVIDDEFLFMTAEQVGAQAPVLATRSLHGNARAYRASSAAAMRSDMLRALRRRAVAGDPTLTYVGWWAAGGWENPGCVSPACSHELGSAGCALDDEALLRTCNPLVDRLVSVEFLRSMRAGMTPLEFGREFLGWQETPISVGGALPYGRWSGLADPAAERGESPVFGLDVAEDRTAWFAVAWRRPDGAVQVMLANGGQSLPAHRAVDEAARLSGDWGGVLVPPRAFEDDLERAGVPLSKMSSAEFAGACGAFADAVTAGTVRHGNQPALNTAVKAAVWRSAGTAGERAFQLKGFPEVGPLAAAVRALCGLTQTSMPAFAFS